MAKYDIKKLRQESKMRQQDLAKALGVSQGFLSSIENGKNLFPYDRIDLLQRAFPDKDIEKYELLDDITSSNLESSGSVGSGNTLSTLNINSPEALKILSEFLTEYSKRVQAEDEKQKQSISHEAELVDRQNNQLRDKIDKLYEKLDETRCKYDKLYEEFLSIKEENSRLKELLRSNHIYFDKE